MYPSIIESKDKTIGQRFFKSKQEHQAVKDGKIVESANTLLVPFFRLKYLPSDLLSDLSHTKFENLPKFSYLFDTAATLRGPFIDRCFDLIESTSANDYRNSEIKWSPAKKRKEMMLPDLRYIFLESLDCKWPEVKSPGFTSFMITYEDGREVIYVYEIHLTPEYQGKGIGKKLMEIVEQTGRNVGVEKAMLTVFRSNEKALGMYRSLGYVEDEFSPEPRKLRNGTTKEPTYVILSKRLREADRKINEQGS